MPRGEDMSLFQMSYLRRYVSTLEGRRRRRCRFADQQDIRRGGEYTSETEATRSLRSLPGNDPSPRRLEDN
jgi:hypothetical protein